jgi:GNAT superfamily N-acetyltransferase
MLRYREANSNDIERIARLHADSWSKHYRGILSDDFLDNHVYDERLGVWDKRLKFPNENQYVLLAEKDGALCGLACIYLDDDPQFGTLLDNLHVVRGSQGAGIGTELIRLVAQKSHDHNPGSGFYLWALEENYKARKFYENLGAKNYETVLEKNPDDSFTNSCRYVWTSVTELI